MTTKYAELVKKAEIRLAQRDRPLHIEIAELKSRFSFAEESRYGKPSFEPFAPYSREIGYVNNHITVSPDEINAARAAYTRVGALLIDRLQWNEEDITILPQGSASTQTLIRTPDNSKFDIDAVCQVNISRISARDPMAFFDSVGDALNDLGPERKKRCWRINEGNTSFYLDFTPSVPLNKVPSVTMESMELRLSSEAEYKQTELAVVDTPSASWKTSNPEGFTQWVNRVSELKLMGRLALAEEAYAEALDRIDPVPDQEVDLSDTLRIAIRLFKRHRDMCVRRGTLETETKPISVLIVTLLTSCYAGLSEEGHTYGHPIELLANLAELMPNMVELRDGEHWVANPTVEGENFAERWNEDGGKRQKAFNLWCEQLLGDLRIILACKEESDIRQEVRRVFGCPGSISDGGSASGGDRHNLQQNAPNRPTPAPKSRGLA